jgi:hypothetical protein
MNHKHHQTSRTINWPDRPAFDNATAIIESMEKQS